MARAKNNNRMKPNNGANVGYEAELWQMADALRGSMDAAEYKHVVLGLIFLKYISDAFGSSTQSWKPKRLRARRQLELVQKMQQFDSRAMCKKCTSSESFEATVSKKEIVGR
jgi:type I restriction-modification system DNA methylase subunit